MLKVKIPRPGGVSTEHLYPRIRERHGGEVLKFLQFFNLSIWWSVITSILMIHLMPGRLESYFSFAIDVLFNETPFLIGGFSLNLQNNFLPSWECNIFIFEISIIWVTRLGRFENRNVHNLFSCSYNINLILKFSKVSNILKHWPCLQATK